MLAGEIEAAVAAAEQVFRAEIAAARTGRLMADVEAVLARLPKPTPTPGRPSAAAQRTGPTTHVAEALERVLRRMDAGTPPSMVTTLQKRAVDALAVQSEADALRLLDDLRYSVERVNEQTGRRKSRLRELAGRMAGYDGPAIELARAHLAAAHEQAEPDLVALAATVDAAIEETLAPAIREYTRQALRESLEEAGCTVEEGFEVALGRDGLAHVRGPGWDDLAVRVRSRPEQNAYYFNLVAPTDAAVPDVAELEHEWCGAVDKLLPALGARGLQVETTHRSEEGDPDVQRIDPARFPFERRRRDERRRGEQQQRRRELPR